MEVDITHTDIDKLRLYASLGVPELWRYNAEVWRIYCLQGDEYLETGVSPTLPRVLKAKLYARLDEMEAERVLREWVRSL